MLPQKVRFQSQNFHEKSLRNSLETFKKGLENEKESRNFNNWETLAKCLRNYWEIIEKALGNKKELRKFWEIVEKFPRNSLEPATVTLWWCLLWAKHDYDFQRVGKTKLSNDVFVGLICNRHFLTDISGLSVRNILYLWLVTNFHFRTSKCM